MKATFRLTTLFAIGLLLQAGCSVSTPQPAPAAPPEPAAPAEPTAHLYQISDASVAGTNGAMAILVGFSLPVSECEAQRDSKNAEVPEGATTRYACRR